MADVKALIKKRGTIKASISRVNTFADNFDADTSDHHALKIKLRHLMELSAKYDDIQTQIEADDWESASAVTDFKQRMISVLSNVSYIIY